MLASTSERGLIAEISASSQATMTNISTPELDGNNDAYIQSWLKPSRMTRTWLSKLLAKYIRLWIIYLGQRTLDPCPSASVV